MKLTKSFDRLTQALSVAIQEADDYGEEEMKEMLGLLMQFYLNDGERQFHNFFIEVVNKYKRYTDF